jgi:glyoxylase-like metal-dependent hydrolase (beta-lactamase superfamily II)
LALTFCFVVILHMASAAQHIERTPTVGARTPYSIEAVRYATVPHFPLHGLVMGAPKGQFIDIAMVFWVIRGGGRIILFDSGFHRQHWIEDFHARDFASPDKALERADIPPSSVTDIIISHAHWDHLGGIDLFPKADIWIQKAEYDYYTGAAWQPGGRHGGIDPEDVLELVRRNTRGQVHLVDGDNMEIFPGIRVFTGARHTFASEYIRVDGNPPYVLASDNVYLYQNLREHRASATFDRSDESANLAAQQRMSALACGAGAAVGTARAGSGSAGPSSDGLPCDRIIPGHDPAQFQRYPTTGRVAHIR